MENTKTPGPRSGQTNTVKLNEILRAEVKATAARLGISLKPTASARPPAGYGGGFAAGWSGSARRQPGRMRR